MTALLAALLLLASTWTETWSDTSAWQPITQACFSAQQGSVAATCQSGALLSTRTWDPSRPIFVEAQRVCGQPAPGSSTTRYWAGVALYQDEAHYGELATERNVPPFQSYADPLIVSLDPYGHVLYSGSVGGCYDFRLDYDPTQPKGKRGWAAYVNGQMAAFYRTTFTAPLHMWLGCVSVGEATPDDGSAAQCSFGPVSVTQ